MTYVDIDAHHGDGVEHAFYDTDQVLTISLHESGRYLFPGTGFPQDMGTGKGRGYAVNLPLEPYTDNETYLWLLETIVVRLVQAFNPDILVTQLGIDTHFNELLTHLHLSVQGFAQAIGMLAGLSSKWLALGGGGYDFSAVARGWVCAYGLMLGHQWPDNIPEETRSVCGNTLHDLEVPRIDESMRQTSSTRRRGCRHGSGTPDFPHTTRFEGARNQQ